MKLEWPGQKQPGIIDDLTEDSPILDIIKWKAASQALERGRKAR